MLMPPVAKARTPESAGAARQSKTAERRGDRETPAAETWSGPGWSFAGTSVFPPTLTVGPANDPLEREADRVADHVLGLVAPPLRFTPGPPQLNRKCCAACDEEAGELRRKPSGATNAEPVIAPGIVHQVLRSPGRPLSEATRAFFEPRFGIGFEGVRLHEDARASASARQVGALAYSVGRDVVFDSSRFQPESRSARRLLAHELAHVAQQSQGGAPPVLARQPVDAGRSQDEDRMLNCIVETQRTPAGVISDEDAFEACKKKWNYTGDYLAPTDDDRRQINTGVIIAPNDFRDYQEALKKYQTWREAGTVPSDLQQWVDPQIDLAQRLLAPYMPEVEKTEEAGGKPGPAAMRTQLAALPAIAAVLAAQRTVAGAQAAGALARAAAQWGVAGSIPEAAAVATGTAETTAVVGTGAAVGTAAAPVVGVVLAVAALALAGYLTYRFLKWLGTVEVVPTYPQLPDAVRETTRRIDRTGEHLAPPQPQPQPQPQPVPVPQPDEDRRRRRRCQLPTGLSPKDPIPIVWFKPKHDSFYPRYISIMDGVLDRDDPNTRLPDGTRVGVRPQYWPSCNKIMQLIPQPRGDKATEYRADLAHFGFDWQTMQPDHVQDLFWDGPDAFGNLWPYEASTNMSTGSTQNRYQFIDFCLTEDGPAYVNQRLYWNRELLNGRYFIIKRFRMHSGAPDLITCP